MEDPITENEAAEGFKVTGAIQFVVPGRAKCVKTERPTKGLRFVMKDGRRILQQEWLITIQKHDPTSITLSDGSDYEHTLEWRDIPLVEV